MNETAKNVKQIRYFNRKLYLKIDEQEEIELGKILTRKGGLTRQQKLNAVFANGKWIKI